MLVIQAIVFTRIEKRKYFFPSCSYFDPDYVKFQTKRSFVNLYLYLREQKNDYFTRIHEDRGPNGAIFLRFGKGIRWEFSEVI